MNFYSTLDIAIRAY